MMNCVQARKSLSTSVKRSMLASSNAASTSSSTQNGLGRLRNIASSRATQVSVFSPPLSSEMLRGSLPGGRATISMPLSRMSTPSSSTMSAWPPPNRSRNSVWKCSLTVSSVSANSRRLSALILSMIFSSEVLAPVRSWCCATASVKRASSCSSFVEGFEIHVAEVVDLLPQIVDLLLHLFAARRCSSAVGCVLQLRPARCRSPRASRSASVCPLVADFVGRQVLGVQLLFQLADLGPRSAATSCGQLGLAAAGSASRRLISSTLAPASTSLRR